MRDQILKLIRQHQAEHGYPPTITEMADALGSYREKVKAEMVKMEWDGLITWERGKPWTLRVVDEGMEG